MKYIRTKDGKIFDIDKIKKQIIQNMCQSDRDHISCWALTPTTDLRGALELSWILDYRDSAGIKKDTNIDGLVKKGAVILNCEMAEYKQADTIEELCDEFVEVKNGDTFGSHFAWNKRSLNEYNKYRKNTNAIYGAIWTEWGLKYVAKMNEKGDLELL